MTNPLLDDLNSTGAIPHVEIALPTRGFFYPAGEILKNGTDPENVSIGPLSVLNESMFKDPMMLVSGSAIANTINRVTNVVSDVGRLCEIDIQAMLLATRIASYGPTLTIDHTCPKCDHPNTMALDLNTHIQRFSPFTPEEFARFNITLDDIGQTVQLRPIPYNQSIDMTIDIIKSGLGVEQFKNITDNDALSSEFIALYREQFEKSIETNIAAITASIYFVATQSNKKVFDAVMIHEWLLSLPPEAVKQITVRISEINEAIQARSKVEYQCVECGTISSLFVELDPQKLFTLAGESEPAKNSSAKPQTTKKSTKPRSKVSAK